MYLINKKKLIEIYMYVTGSPKELAWEKLYGMTLAEIEDLYKEYKNDVYGKKEEV